MESHEHGFHDPIAAKPEKKNVRTPFNFEAPQYDDRTKICAGTHHGVGHRNPVGHAGAVKQTVPALPQNKKRIPIEKPEYSLGMEE
jgi:hypothetical protein